MTKKDVLEALLRDYRCDPETGELFKRVGHKAANGYTRIYAGGRPVQAHRAVWAMVHGKWPTHHVDHINGNRADNRLENLRDVPRATNQQNERRARTNSRSGLLGASWSKAMKRWTARIHHDGKHHFIGYFDTAEAAHAAYLNAKRQRHSGCTI